MFKSLCVLKSIPSSNRSVLVKIGNVHQRELHTNQITVREIQIPVRWGHIAAKLWGAEDQRPILAIHGWQDNAGTWDTLISMLNMKRPVLAIDLPGHGFSSRNPPGIPYDVWQWVQLISHLKDHFKWNKVSLLSHSLGSVTCFRYATVFPDDVDLYIGLETLDFYDYTPSEAQEYVDKVQKYRARDERTSLNHRFYTFDDMCQLWHLHSNKSISLKSVPHLMKRGALESQSEPGKYCFSRDDRLKSVTLIPESKEFVNSMSKRLVCPTLFIKGRESHDRINDYMASVRQTIMQNNSKFENYVVPGTHHVHLNNPQHIAPLIIQFLEKHHNTII